MKKLLITLIVLGSGGLFAQSLFAQSIEGELIHLHEQYSIDMHHRCYDNVDQRTLQEATQLCLNRALERYENASQIQAVLRPKNHQCCQEGEYELTCSMMAPKERYPDP